ncbi:MAG: DUF1552 domain-containing protein [Rubrivivax sp.]
MKPAFNRFSRRQFLVGTGGTLLALPLLPSLLPREVRAATEAAAAAERYFVHMTTWHGVFQSQFFGPLLDQTPTLTANEGGVAVRARPLTPENKDGDTVISDILRAKASALTPRMVSRMNVINGLDYHTSVGHNRGYSLGGDTANPTIDQVLANAPSFYPSKPRQGAIVRNLVSLSRSGTATVQTEQTAESNTKLFDRLFGGSTTGSPGTGTTAPERVVLVDRVKAHADQVLADPACGTDCRNRLTNYMDLLNDIESKLPGASGGSTAPVNSSFTRPTTDTGSVENSSGFYGEPARQAQCEQLWNDIVVAAFAAGISRVYVCGPHTYTFGPDPEHAWHNNYAHSLDDPARRAGFNAAVRLQFEGALLDMANKLDAITSADGRSLFDKALLATAFELGSGGNPGHHHNRCIPVATLGDAGGFFRTGLYADYRDLTSFGWSSDPHWYSGLLYNQWMGMVLRSMGVTQADMNTTTWGYPNVRGPNGDHTDGIWNAARNNLPWLKA